MCGCGAPPVATAPANGGAPAIGTIVIDPRNCAVAPGAACTAKPACARSVQAPATSAVAAPPLARAKPPAYTDTPLPPNTGLPLAAARPWPPMHVVRNSAARPVNATPLPAATVTAAKG